MTNSLFGASFSLHRCHELQVNKKELLTAAIKELGIRRFRLMSYWNIHEATRGNYNFDELDWQLDMIAQVDGKVTLCLGVRQPRWPEFHMPKWAEALPTPEWHEALLRYIDIVVKRYKDHPAMESWQLENEALLKTFGHGTNIDYDHSRLKREYVLVKSLDKQHPVIMTLSDSWGIPVRGPKPDMYAMSLYRITINNKGKLVYSRRPAAFYRLRAMIIKILRWRSVFIHELQAEPWFSKGITEIPIEAQVNQMGPEQLTKNLAFAQKTGMKQIDLWGLEWWYWLKTMHGYDDAWDVIKNLASSR